MLGGVGGAGGAVLAGAVDGWLAEGLLLFDVVGEVTKCLDCHTVSQDL